MWRAELKMKPSWKRSSTFAGRSGWNLPVGTFWFLCVCLACGEEAVLCVEVFGCTLPRMSISGGCWQLLSREKSRNLKKWWGLVESLRKDVCCQCLLFALHLKQPKGLERQLLGPAHRLVLSHRAPWGFEGWGFSKMCVLQDTQPSALLSSLFL